MRRPNRLFWISSIVALAATLHAVDVDASKLPPAVNRSIDYARDVQPLFERHCYSCHSQEKQRSGLRLDDKESALKGGETFAPDIKPGNSADSPLIHFVSGAVSDMQMPPKGERLTAEEIGILRAWIDQGAAWPEVGKRKTHWALVPVQRPAVPAGVKNGNAIDAFIVAKLRGSKLTPSPPADRRTLARRLFFGLAGLPPTPADVEQFVSDKRGNAHSNLVERLLDSPRYGERWARHWLDVVRFAETHGFEMNQPRANAWPYRDYVIRAFNEDKPYDLFVVEQLAGDVLGVDEATGFLVAGPWDQVKSPDPVLTANQRADELHDIVSTTGSTFLGLTVGCARCHNHKFDPIPQNRLFCDESRVRRRATRRTQAAYAARTGPREGTCNEPSSRSRKLKRNWRNSNRARKSATSNTNALRAPVNARRNIERFAPVQAKRLAVHCGEDDGCRAVHR